MVFRWEHLQGSSAAGEDGIDSRGIERNNEKRKTGEVGQTRKCRVVGVATVDPIDDFLINPSLAFPRNASAEYTQFPVIQM